MEVADRALTRFLVEGWVTSRRVTPSGVSYRINPVPDTE